MRQRLIDATLHCLANDGYAGTTISRVIEVAQVSRGAPVHHFPSKNAMIAAAAEQLVRRIYVQLGRSIACLQASDDRLHDLIYASWKGVFQRSEYVALNELLQASRREPELAQLLQRLWTASYHVLGNNADHYMEPCASHVDVRQLMVLTQWLLRGMAEDISLVEDASLFDHYLRLWTQMLALQMRAKQGVTSPPPKPALWDSGLFSDSNFLDNPTQG
jgi:AcrR family transcriptional regulator